MSNLMILGNAPLTMSSREIAELTGKEHFHVMRDLRILKEQLGEMFGGSIQFWIHPQNGQQYEEFVLDKDTSLTLLTGYDAVARMKVVKRARVFKQWVIDKGFGEVKQTEQGFSQPLFTTAGEAWIVERLITEGVAA